jgi:hypothetical protein
MRVMDQWIIATLAIWTSGFFMLGYGLGRKERNNVREQFKQDLDAFIDDTEQRVGRTP